MFSAKEIHKAEKSITDKNIKQKSGLDSVCFKTFTEFDKVNGRAFMSHYKPAQNKKPIMDLKISTKNRGNIYFGEAEEKGNYFMFLSQYMNDEKSYNFSHHRKLDEISAKKIRVKHSQREIMTSYKNKKAYGAALIKFDKSMSVEKILKGYQGILKDNEVKETAAAKVLKSENAIKEKKQEKMLMKHLKQEKQFFKKNQSDKQKEFFLNRNINFLRRQITLKEQMSKQIEKNVRSSVENIKRYNKTDIDDFLNIMKLKKLYEEENSTLQQKDENLNKNINNK